MPSDNMSRPTTDAYRDGWERTFGLRAIMAREHDHKVACLARMCEAGCVSPSDAAEAFGDEVAEALGEP